MRCEYCDEPAAVHLTGVDAETGRKTEVHVCLRHAGRAGLAADTVGAMAEKMESARRAMETLRAFVASERRVPSADELRALGVADAVIGPEDDPLFPTQLGQLRAMARMMLEESPQPPQPG